jgi:NADPH-dependent F420 reductase
VKIAVLGTGGVGSVLGTRWAAAGHHVVFGSRDPAHEKIPALLARGGERTRVVHLPLATAEADVIVIALPWPATRESLAAFGDLSGRIVIDCTNPLKSDLSGLDVPHDTSAAEQIAAWAPGAHVVKAFNTASSKVMNDPQFGEQQATMFYCGDDAPAKAIVKQLIADLGFEPVDAGSLAVARYLESLAMFYIHLAFRQGWGSNCAIQLLTR